MFQSATLRLTIIYLGILLAICLVFNAALYSVLSSELTHNYSLQSNFFEDRPRFQPFIRDPEALRFRNEQLEQGKRRILSELFYIDIALLGAGGFASYFLAKRTLQPIEEAHEAQVRFTADASHELRTPLATMQTEIEVALRDPAINLKDTKELLESNLEEIATLRQLTNGLLALARGRESSISTSAQLKKVTDEAVDRVSKLARNRKISLINKVAKNLTVNGEEAQLIEAIVILLDNAVKYSHETQEVKISSHTGEDRTDLIIADSGIGIAATDLPRVFERFYRADSARTKSKQNGHGLGLSIAQQIIEQYSGSIHIDSTEGTGTTVTVTFLNGVAG